MTPKKKKKTTRTIVREQHMREFTPESKWDNGTNHVDAMRTSQPKKGRGEKIIPQDNPIVESFILFASSSFLFLLLLNLDFTSIHTQS